MPATIRICSIVGDILNDTGTVKILEKYAPGISRNPMPGLATGMTLKSLLAMPQARDAAVTEEMVRKVLAEINALKKWIQPIVHRTGKRRGGFLVSAPKSAGYNQAS